MSQEATEILIEDERRRILETVQELQAENRVPGWVLNHGDVIRSVALGQAVRWGPRGRQIRRLLDWTGTGLPGRLLVTLIGAAIATRWWWRSSQGSHLDATHLMLGFGAGAERALFDQYRREQGVGCVLLDQNDARSLGQVSRPGYWVVIRGVWVAWGCAHRGIHAAGLTAIAAHKLSWFAVGAARLGEYAFVHAWMTALPASVRTIVFIASDIHCHAAVDARDDRALPRIEYWQHGLRYANLLMPHVDHVRALDVIEGGYLAGLCHCSFDLLEAPDHPAWPGQPVLLFASIYAIRGFDHNELIDDLACLFSWARVHELRVVVRLHPKEAPDFWVKNFPDIEMERDDFTFRQCVDHLQPRFVASWISTALLDAVRWGVMPIMLRKGSVEFLRQMLLPLEQLAHPWPSETGVLDRLADDTDFRLANIGALQARLFDNKPWAAS